MSAAFIGHGEVRLSSARASNSKYVLAQQPDGHIWLFTVDGDKVRELDRAVRSDTQPVFDYSSKDHIYGSEDHVFTVSGNQVWRNNLPTDAAELIASFPEFVTLSAAHAEGDLQPDGSLALCGVKEDTVSGATWEEPFLFNVYTKAKGPVYPQTEPFDGLKAAGSHLLLSKASGIYDLTTGIQVTTVNGHACPAKHSGNDVLLWCNSNENPVTRPNFPNAVVMVNISDGYQIGLKSFDWAYAMHISVGPDCAIVSVYDDPAGPHTKGLPFQIWRVPMDGSEPTLLFEWYGAYSALYQPRASYSNGRVFFNGWNGHECSVWGLKLDRKPVEVSAEYKDGPVRNGFDVVSMANEADADYVMELPVRGGKALPWKMWKRTL